MSTQQPQNTSYGLSQAIIPNSPSPVVAKRNPLTSDFMQVGTVWCNITTNSVYILASITNNSANWVLLEAGGGAGNFASLTVNPGPTNITGTMNVSGNANINTIGAGNTTIGGAANTTDIAGTVEINTDVLSNGTTSIGVNGNQVVSIGNATGETFIEAGNLYVSAGNVIISGVYEFAAGPRIVVGAGDPNGVVGGGVGSLYLNTAPTGTMDRLFINTDGGTTWTYFTSNA